MSLPILSIVIPTRLRSGTLQRCLAEITSQSAEMNDFPIEIIVTEDSEENESEKVATRFKHTRWTKGPCKGPAANRNHAAAKSKGEWLLFLDDDVLPQPGFLKAYANAIQSGSAEVLEGRMICLDERNSPFYRMAENKRGNHFFTANLAVKREAFEELNGFDEELIIMEDLEFAHRLKTSGKRISFLAKATVDHPAQRFSLSYFWRWIFHFKWGLLLRYKTGEANPKRTLPKALFETTRNHLVLMARKTVHLFTQHNPKSWVNAWVWQAWGWLTLPLTLPYLWYWEMRYLRKYRTRPVGAHLQLLP